MTDRQMSAWERLVIGVSAPVIAAAIIGIYASVSSLKDSISTVDRHQAVTQSQVEDMRASLNGIYLRRDAEKRHEEIFRTNQDQYDRLDDHEERIRRLEGQ